MYGVGSPECKVFSNQYSGLCSTLEINKGFEAPCELDEFKARYADLCDEDDFITKYEVQGMNMNYSSLAIFCQFDVSFQLHIPPVLQPG
jgi:hypothetical protein